MPCPKCGHFKLPHEVGHICDQAAQIAKLENICGARGDGIAKREVIIAAIAAERDAAREKAIGDCLGAVRGGSKCRGISSDEDWHNPVTAREREIEKAIRALKEQSNG